MSEMPEIGSKISLISKADIRYEGNLFTVNPTECTIALANVRSFGTEDREVENVVPAHSGTYEFIMFRGSDIKDIKVVNNQMPMNDPAIVDYTGGPSSMKAPGYHHPSAPQGAMHHQDSYNPMMGGGAPMGGSSQFSQGAGLYNPMSSMAPGMGRTLIKPQQLHQQQRAILDLISGGSRSSTPGLLSRKSPTIDQSIQVSGGHKGVSFGGASQHHGKDDNKRGGNRDGGNRNRGGGSGAIGDHGYNKSRGGGGGGAGRGGNNGGFVGGAGGDNKEYRQQRRETFSINHIRPGMQDQQQGGNQLMRQQNNNQGQQQQRGWGGNQRGGYNQQQGGGGGGFNNGGGPGNQGQANRQRGRGGGGGNHQQQRTANFNRAPGQQLQPGANAQKNKLKFESDYDFDKANNEFEELRSQIAKVKIGDGDAASTGAADSLGSAKVNGESGGAADSSLKKDESSSVGAETGEQGAGAGDEDGGGDEAQPIYYDKAKSFFDNISCEAVERSKGRSQRTDWRTERKLNSETFGVASARRGNFRGRGGYYGGGGRGGNQGGGGYHRGGGGGGAYHHNNRMGYNHQNWQRNSYNNRAAHQHHNNATAVAAGSGDTA